MAASSTRVAVLGHQSVLIALEDTLLHTPFHGIGRPAGHGSVVGKVLCLFALHGGRACIAVEDSGQFLPRSEERRVGKECM